MITKTFKLTIATDTEEQMRKEEEHLSMIYGAEEIEALEQQPCEDVISRQAVLDALDKSKYSNEFCEEHHIDWSINLGMAHIVVNELKPVTPQSKIGRWIIIDDCERFIAKCSECGRIEDSRMINKYPYCHCGAKMEVEAESEDEE